MGITKTVRNYNAETEKVYLLIVCSSCNRQITGIYSYDKYSNYCSNCNPNKLKHTINLKMREAVMVRKTTPKAMNKDPESESKFTSKFTKDELKKMDNMTIAEYDEYLKTKK